MGYVVHILKGRVLFVVAVLVLLAGCAGGGPVSGPSVEGVEVVGHEGNVSLKVTVSETSFDPSELASGGGLDRGHNYTLEVRGPNRTVEGELLSRDIENGSEVLYLPLTERLTNVEPGRYELGIRDRETGEPVYNETVDVEGPDIVLEGVRVQSFKRSVTSGGRIAIGNIRFKNTGGVEGYVTGIRISVANESQVVEEAVFNLKTPMLLEPEDQASIDSNVATDLMMADDYTVTLTLMDGPEGSGDAVGEVKRQVTVN